MKVRFIVLVFADALRHFCRIAQATSPCQCWTAMTRLKVRSFVPAFEFSNISKAHPGHSVDWKTFPVCLKFGQSCCFHRNFG